MTLFFKKHSIIVNVSVLSQSIPGCSGHVSKFSLVRQGTPRSAPAELAFLCVCDCAHKWVDEKQCQSALSAIKVEKRYIRADQGQHIHKLVSE